MEPIQESLPDDGPGGMRPPAVSTPAPAVRSRQMLPRIGDELKPVSGQKGLAKAEAPAGPIQIEMPNKSGIDHNVVIEGLPVKTNIVKNGVAKSKPVYAAQMAIYQAYMEASIPGISQNPALFTAINKDSQEIWFELVPFDGGLAQRMSDRAVRVITATDAGEVLPRFSTTPTHQECRFCSWQERCWGGS